LLVLYPTLGSFTIKLDKKSKYVILLRHYWETAIRLFSGKKYTNERRKVAWRKE